jgi:hypothetical protein
MGYSFDLDVFEVFALDREDVASLVLWVVTLAVPTTFQFHQDVTRFEEPTLRTRT